MHPPLSPRLRRIALAAAFGIAAATPCLGGGVHFDGSVGPSTALSGPNYLIPANAGKQMGGNLFHSFSQFDLSSGEVATFQAPGSGSISNILARITSGSASTLDGTIRSEIPGANLFLINPAGFIFNQNFHLDISGSFTATSASSVKLSDGAHFDAHPGTSDLTLSSAPISAFGFVSVPGSIKVNGTIAVPSGSGLSLVGGNITLNHANLSAPGGSLALISATSTGQIGTNLKAPNAHGIISMSQSTVDTSGPTGGSVVIRGGQLTLNNSCTISSNTQGSGKGGQMNIRIAGSTNLSARSTIKTTTSGAGAAGDLSVSSSAMGLTTNSFIGSQALTTTTSTAKAGKVNINSGSLTISGESEISTSTFGAGHANTVTVGANNITLVGDSSGIPTGIFSNSIPSGAGGRGGDIRLFATNTLTILNGASISADTFGLARGGDVSVGGGSIYIAAQGATTKTGIFADSDSLGTGGHGGNITVQALSLQIMDGGLISTKTLGLGSGGDTNIAVRNLTIDRGTSSYFTGIAADTPLGAGAGGVVRVNADSARILDGGQISANTFTSGPGGSVFVQAGDLYLSGRPDLPTGISADSNSTEVGGPGGNVEVIANSIEILNNARISANTFGSGAGGDVSVTARTAFIYGSDPSLFTGISAETVSTTAAGSGGNLFVNIGDIVLRGGGGIAGNTLGPGNGGDVHITSNTVSLKDGGSIAAATKGTGNGGAIFLAVDDLSISGKGGLSTGIFSDSLAAGQGGAGGRVEIDAHTVELQDGAGIGASSAGSGVGGSVDLTAQRLTLDGGASIAASATGSGMAGSIDIATKDPLEVRGASNISTTSAISDAGTVSVTSATDINLDQGSITVQAMQGNAGQIALAARHELNLSDSQLLAAAGTNGGNITIDPVFVILDHSLISANAAGRGGNITLVANYYFNSETPITATGSQAGTINIESPELNLANGLVTLPGGVIDASSQIREQCALRLGLDFSSFLVLGRGGVELSPTDAQPSIGIPTAHPASVAHKR